MFANNAETDQTPRSTATGLVQHFFPMPHIKEIGLNALEFTNKMSFDMRFPTMWYVRPAKAQISLRIYAV